MSRPQSVCFGQVRNKSESMFCFPLSSGIQGHNAHNSLQLNCDNYLYYWFSLGEFCGNMANSPGRLLYHKGKLFV